MSLGPVRWGVLGAAGIATKKVIPAMATCSSSVVTALASRDHSRAVKAADRLGIERAYGSYEELLADPDIEAVYIPLPNHLHLEWTIAAAESGKHVLCEKPLAVTVADARRMIDACAAADVLLMEAFMYRLHPLWRATIERVRSGTIGTVRSVHTTFAYHNVDPANIRNVAEFGGGALYDIGCYAINVARLVFDAEPTRVHGAVYRDPQFGTDAITSGLLDFGDGRHSTFVCSTQLESSQRVEIVGSSGQLVVEIPFNIPPDRPTRLLQIAGGEPPVAPGVSVIDIPTADPYAVQADAFSDAVRNHTPVPIPTSDAVANLEVIERIFADAAR